MTPINEHAEPYDEISLLDLINGLENSIYTSYGSVRLTPRQAELANMELERRGSKTRVFPVRSISITRKV